MKTTSPERQFEPRVGDLWTASKNWEAAFANDPLYHYVREGKKQTRAQNLYNRVMISSLLFSWRRTKITITLNHGSSVVIATPPSKGHPQTPRDKFTEWFQNTVLSLSSIPNGCLKREEEVNSKLEKVVSEKVGERAKVMIYVDLVFTAPESQGHGYASTLLKTLTTLADTLGQACWLVSSNIVNEPFYNSHGFISVGELLLGNENPSWHEKPVRVQVSSKVLAMDLFQSFGFGPMQGYIDKEFWSSLMKLDEVEVGWLEDKDVWPTTKKWYEAFDKDPLRHYMRAGVKETARMKLISRIAMSCMLHAWRRTRITITINHGSSLVIAAPPSSNPSPKVVLLNWFADMAVKIRNKSLTKAEKKRAAEYRAKIDKVISEQIGARAKEMIFVDLVVTARESQGHGYASALLGTITGLADLMGRACWLISSNTANEKFYNSHGFQTVGEAVLGTDNPDWHESPVRVQVMVREP
ncbi:hypothetical protein MD484_g5884, partial [Candolleomyces efflorescens]